jgi:RNA polymerase sigma factor (TIGR02999 family)
MPLTPDEVTELLAECRLGNREAFERLIPILYDELRRIAARYLRSERPGHTLQPTALVHEAYLRLCDQQDVQWQNRAHFLGCAAQVMRNLLVDHARARRAAKRGGGERKLTLSAAALLSREPELDLVALDEALRALEGIDPVRGRVVELPYFAGLGVEQTAEVLGIAPATVKRHWTTARAWLRRELGRGERA